MIDIGPAGGPYIYKVAAQLVANNGSNAMVSGTPTTVPWLRGTLTASSSTNKTNRDLGSPAAARSGRPNRADAKSKRAGTWAGPFDERTESEATAQCTSIAGVGVVVRESRQSESRIA